MLVCDFISKYIITQNNMEFYEEDWIWVAFEEWFWAGFEEIYF